MLVIGFARKKTLAPSAFAGAAEKAGAVPYVELEPWHGGGTSDCSSLNGSASYYESVGSAVKAGGIGTLDRARLERQIDTIVEAFTLPARPALDAIYDGQYLPSAAERRL